MSPNLVLLALHRCNVRPTRVRESVLQRLCQSPFALSGADIEKQLVPPADRITLYRTLRLFEERGLIHRVIDHCEIVRYAICVSLTAPGAGADHVHFKCSACQHIYCLSEVAVPRVVLPDQYRVVRGDHLLSGVCARCQPA